ncbi:MAG: thiol reductase thioredoxin [Candidatus Methylomirabilota bacterium]|nr:thioredoxin TrxA [Candidatus Methylomirabilis sp.]NJD69109.1 thioredoxin TrxA [candidate division NC10 bacterium]PWB44805.1 MAG: thiol reductase thioredoxin [candidate division NC10 bacterium]
MASEKVVHLTDRDFDERVIKGQGLILVDFWAEWCGPCRMIAPILDELANEHDGQVTIAKLNVDENRESTARFGIRSIPTILLFKDGAQVEQIVGALSKSALQAKIQQHL